MIEKMNERTTIQQNAVTVDKYGNHKNGWTDYFSCAAYASTYQYDREKESVITEAEQTVIFEVRYCSELKSLDSTHFRIRFRDGLYNIQSVDMMNYQRKTIRIRCQKEVR